MSLESHYEFGTDVALSILAVIITMVDNHFIHLYISALYPHAAAHSGIIFINTSAHLIPDVISVLNVIFSFIFRTKFTPYHQRGHFTAPFYASPPSHSACELYVNLYEISMIVRFIIPHLVVLRHPSPAYDSHFRLRFVKDDPNIVCVRLRSPTIRCSQSPLQMSGCCQPSIGTGTTVACSLTFYQVTWNGN